jgi:hypothetical protein
MTMKNKIFTSILIATIVFSLLNLGGHIVSADEIADYVVDSLSSLQNAITSVQPGNTVYIRGGIYQPTSQLRFTKSGVSGNPITWCAYPGEKVIFNGSSFSGIGWEPPFIHITGNWNVFENFEVRNNVVGRGIYIASSDCIFRNVVSHNNYGSGFYAVNSYRNQFLSLIAYANSDPADDGGNADGISIESGSNNVIRYCLCHTNSDDGIDTWQSTSNLIENCVCYNNGLMLGNGNGFKFGPGGYNTLRRCVSYHNKKPTTVAGGRGFTANGGIGSLVEFCTSYMNDEYEFLNPQSLFNTYRNNIAVGAPNGGMAGSAVHDHNTWNLGITNPKFVSINLTSPDFLKLNADSPCIGVSSDNTDLGAYQYSEEPTPTPPPHIVPAGIEILNMIIKLNLLSRRKK